MSIPESLARKIEVFRSCGRVALYSEESFLEPSWVAIFIGQQWLPRRYDPIIDGIDLERLKRGMQRRREAIRAAAATLPTHRAFIARHCAAPEPEPA
jgi:tryptophan halogenase